MKTERLVEMLNDITAFFQTEPERRDAVVGITNHVKRFWDPRMRAQIIDHDDAGGVGLDHLAREAVAALKADVQRGGRATR